MGGKGHFAGIQADPTGRRDLAWIIQLNASGPCVLSKMVEPGGRTGHIMLTNGLEINRFVKPLPCCLLFFRTLGRRQKRAGVENKEKA